MMTLSCPGRPPFSERELVTDVELRRLAERYGVTAWEIEDVWDRRPKSLKTLEQCAIRAANLKEQRARRLAHETGAT